jgi:hypothetical protein
MVTFTATVNDPDNDVVTLEWSSQEMVCPTPFDKTKRPQNGQEGQAYSLQLRADKASELCIWVLATDRYGATDVFARTVTAGNRAPIAQVDVQQPTKNTFGRYDLYSNFRISGARSSDPDMDPVTRTWTLRAPDASDAVLVDCSPTSPEDLVKCFSPGKYPGEYRVELLVNDGIENSAATALVIITVDPDSAPCIKLTTPPYTASPLVLDPAQPWPFAVLNVHDDGDPFPGASAPRGSATFDWKLRHNGGEWRAIPGFESLPSVLIAGDTFAIGDHVDLRVEVLDRVPLHSLAACGATDVCPTDCPQRVTWNVDYR